jgi:hypothetical protein
MRSIFVADGGRVSPLNSVVTISSIPPSPVTVGVAVALAVAVGGAVGGVVVIWRIRIFTILLYFITIITIIY